MRQAARPEVAPYRVAQPPRFRGRDVAERQKAEGRMQKGPQAAHG